jgi:hypothetical protein
MRRCAILVAVLLTPFVLAEEPAKDKVNPPYKNWSSFKVGTTCSLKQTIKDESGDDPNTIDATARPAGPHESVSTFKLIESTPEKVVIQQVQTEYDPGSETEHAPVKITYRAKVGPHFGERILTKSQVGDFKEGEEELTVDGKAVPCHWASSVIKVGDEVSISKLWWSDKIPGGTVKQVTIKKQGDKTLFETTTELVHYHVAGE